MMHGARHGHLRLHCAPCPSVQHGCGGGLTSGQFDTEAIHTHALSAAAPFGRLVLFPFISLLITLMSAESKLDAFPGNKPLASDALDWLRDNKPRLTSDQRSLAV